MPLRVEGPTFIVNMDVTEPPEGGVTEAKSKAAVVFAGRPENVKSTAALNPFRDVTVTVELPDSP